MDKWHKWIAYGAIVVFTLLFMTGIGLLVIKPMNDRAKTKIKKSTERAKEYKATSDSLKSVVIHNTDSILARKVIDSVRYVKEKERLQSNYKVIVKKYESKLAAIDTISDSSFNGSFSIRKMLSDSAVELWRHNH